MNRRQAVRRPAWLLRLRNARRVVMADRYPYYADVAQAGAFWLFMLAVAAASYIGGGWR